MATKAGTLRSVGTGGAAARLPAIRPASTGAWTSIHRALATARQRRELTGTRALAELGRSTGARC